MDHDRPEFPGDFSPFGENVTPFRRPGGDSEHLRILEAVLFAAAEPLDEASLAARLPEGAEIGPLLDALKAHYAPRGINLVATGGKWAFRTAADLAFLMHREATDQKRLSRAALETLAIICYHQPVTRAEIEEVRGVAVSKGTVDVLLETGWIRLRGRRRTPGRPVTYGTSDRFLDHFGLESLEDLPGIDELKAAGLLSGDIPAGFEVPGLGGGDGDDDPDDGSEDDGDEDDGDDGGEGLFDEAEAFRSALGSGEGPETERGD
jgi:segregation and condensation protein B